MPSGDAQLASRAESGVAPGARWDEFAAAIAAGAAIDDRKKIKLTEIAVTDVLLKTFGI